MFMVEKGTECYFIRKDSPATEFIRNATKNFFIDKSYLIEAGIDDKVGAEFVSVPGEAVHDSLVKVSIRVRDLKYVG